MGEKGEDFGALSPQTNNKMYRQHNSKIESNICSKVKASIDM